MDNSTSCIALSIDSTSAEDSKKQWIKRIFRRSAKHLYALVVAVALLPVLFQDEGESKKFRCAYVLLLMAFYWMIEPISLYATALMPVALFPLLGVLSTGETSAPYMKATNMMFIGGLLMAIAIEKCNLHKRIALSVLLVIGTGVSRIMLGIMLVTMFLSMWLNNTATTAMMVPIVDAMLQELDPPKSDGNTDIAKDSLHFIKQKAIIRKALLLSIAYSANIGGTGTLTGTGTNLVLSGLYDELYPQNSDLTFSRWFIYAAPGMLICTFFAWAFLWLIFIRKNNQLVDDSEGKMKKIIEAKYQDLGPITFQEAAVIFHFITLILLWFFREPEIFKGWADMIVDDGSIKDGTPAILVALSMFIFPANLHQFYDEKPPKTIETLLDWSTVHKKMSWGVVLLLGGGFALAEGITKSGLSAWLGEQLSHFETLSPRAAMVALTIVAAMVTELASNVATASVILPVVNQLAVKMGAHPLLLMMPVTIAVSFAFMFPVATIKPGIAMNIICIGIELALINSWGQLIFDLNELPIVVGNATVSALAT